MQVDADVHRRCGIADRAGIEMMERLLARAGGTVSGYPQRCRFIARTTHLYTTYKFLHVIGVILLIGNVTATAFWKVMADRASDPILIKHAQRNIIVADWLFTLVGIVLIIAGGYGMVLALDAPFRD